MLKPAATCRMMLFWTVMFFTTDHGAVPLWLRGVNRIEYPCCPADQLFSIMLPSTSTFAAFLNSIRFFTTHDSDIHASGLVIRLRRMVMLEGTRLGMLGSLP